MTAITTRMTLPDRIGMNNNNTFLEARSESMRIILDPSRPRQLSEDGLLVFWRSYSASEQREGLACVLYGCPDPECSCRLVYVDGFAVDRKATAVYRDQGTITQEHAEGVDVVRTELRKILTVAIDAASGDTCADPNLENAIDPALVDWIASEMDGELLDILHRFLSRVKGDPPEGIRQDIDLDEVERYHRADVDALMDGIRNDVYFLNDRVYWTGVFLCPTPGCNCKMRRSYFSTRRRILATRWVPCCSTSAETTVMRF